MNFTSAWTTSGTIYAFGQTDCWITVSHIAIEHSTSKWLSVKFGRMWWDASWDKTCLTSEPNTHVSLLVVGCKLNLVQNIVGLMFHWRFLLHCRLVHRPDFHCSGWMTSPLNKHIAVMLSICSCEIGSGYKTTPLGSCKVWEPSQNNDVTATLNIVTLYASSCSWRDTTGGPKEWSVSTDPWGKTAKKKLLEDCL